MQIYTNYSYNFYSQVSRESETGAFGERKSRVAATFLVHMLVDVLLVVGAFGERKAAGTSCNGVQVVHTRLIYIPPYHVWQRRSAVGPRRSMAQTWRVWRTQIDWRACPNHRRRQPGHPAPPARPARPRTPTIICTYNRIRQSSHLRSSP